MADQHPAPQRKPCNHCDKPIIWARSIANDKPMPLDADPSDRGNVLLSRGPGGILLAGVASTTAAAGSRALGVPTYLHHASSCPFAHAWNKPAAVKRPTRPRRSA